MLTIVFFTLKAIKGIRDCEVEINSGADAQKNINGVGPYIAKKIDEILQQLKTSSKGNQNANSQPQTSTTGTFTRFHFLTLSSTDSCRMASSNRISFLFGSVRRCR